jgi:hypothetical protein
MKVIAITFAGPTIPRHKNSQPDQSLRSKNSAAHRSRYATRALTSSLRRLNVGQNYAACMD